MITVSAPGKLLLFGEHAVVYGQPCIVTAVNQRLSVTAEESADVSIHAPQVKETKFVDATVKAFFSKYGQHGAKLSITSEFSHEVGFGSSSAVTVATIKALGILFDIKLTDREIFDLAYKVTLDIQGVGSGFDIAAATYGGTLYFKKGGGVIEPMNGSDMPLIVGYTGIKADTPSIVRDVAEKQKKYPEKVNKIVEAIGKLTQEARGKMIEADWERVGKLMDFNQEYLRDLGVSSEKLESLIAASKKAGAWGAKLSGAGGGDCMIALAESGKRAAVRKAIQEAGGEVIAVSAQAQGVRVDTTDDQGELFIVVDKDDNVLEFRTRYDCHHDKSLIHRTVGVLIFNKEGQILLQKRSTTKDMEPGVWGISSAGHVTAGQTDEKAVHRELIEELGIDIPLQFLKKFITTNDRETERASLYKGVSEGPFKLDKREASEVKFFDPRQLRLQVASREIQLTKATEQTLREVEILP